MTSVPHPVASRMAQNVAALYGHADDALLVWQRACVQAAEALDPQPAPERLSKALALAQDGVVTLEQDGAALVTSGGFTGAARGTSASVVVNPVIVDEGGKKRSGYYWSSRRHLSCSRRARLRPSSKAPARSPQACPLHWRRLRRNASAPSSMRAP